METITEYAGLITLILLPVLTLILCATLVMVAVIHRSLTNTVRQLHDLGTSTKRNVESQISIRKAIDGCEKKLTQIAEHNLQFQTQSVINTSVEEASRMVGKGAPAQALVESCGLSNREAELMVRLHRSARSKLADYSDSALPVGE